MDYCGLDLGRSSSRFCVVDKERNILRERDVATSEPALRRAFDRKEKLVVVVEASTCAFWVADLLSELGHLVHVVDPNRTKAIGASLIKNDKLDARWLSYLAAAGLLATVRVPTRAQRVARMPATARDSLIRSRTRLLNAVRGMAASEGVRLSKCAPEKLVDQVAAHRDAYPAGMYEAMEPMLDAIEALSVSIDTGTEELVARAKNDPVLVRLQTVPGVGPVTASLYAAAIIDPHRFQSGRQVGAYVGLVPRLYQSGATHRRGQITKRGNRQVRWALTMSANAVLLTAKPSPLADWGKRLQQRVGRKKACVAIARKLASVLWAVWLHELDYRSTADAA